MRRKASTHLRTSGRAGRPTTSAKQGPVTGCTRRRSEAAAEQVQPVVHHRVIARPDLQRAAGFALVEKSQPLVNGHPAACVSEEAALVRPAPLDGAPAFAVPHLD